MAFNPKITEQYQKDLEEFLKQLPLDGTEIKSGTPPSPAPVDAAKHAAAKSTFVTDDRFRKYTGWEHWNLVDKWRGDRTTTCNEFVQKCGNAMGYTDKLGRFDIVDVLMSRGLGHVWVPVESGSTPEYGDVFRLLADTPDENGVRLNHMAISLQVDGSTWYTAESGQGGPIKGYDIIKRRTREWKPYGLRGWISMRALLHADKPLPYWLGGWWEVEEGQYDTWYYHFGANGKVTCTDSPPASPIAPPPTLHCTIGSFKSPAMFKAEISWNSADVDETIVCAQDPGKRTYKLSGSTAKGNPLKGKRLILSSAAELT